MINNKIAFTIYRVLTIIGFILIVLYFGLLLSKLTGYQIINRDSDAFFVMNISLIIVLFLLTISEKVRPALFYFEQSNNEMRIKTYSHNPNSWKSIFNISGKGKMHEYVININEFAGYTLTFGVFGLRKELTLQKKNEKGMFQTSHINISLLGKTKREALLMSLDKIRGGNALS